MRRAVCVFCSSSNAVDAEFFQAAAEMGRLIAQEGHTLVYGGGDVGLMGTLARAVHEHGGHVIGVIPQFMVARGVAYTQADELVVTRDMRERKALMEARSDAFIALPGGFGTLEELLEQLALTQLEQHSKPIVVVNTRGFYDHLVRFVEHICSEHFAKPGHLALCHVASDAREALDYIDRYRPVAVQSKWA
jgi:uncharacterized protein (TIGR00730 family)